MLTKIIFSLLFISKFVKSTTETLYYYQATSNSDQTTCPENLSTITINQNNIAKNFQSTQYPGFGLPNNQDCNIQFVGPQNSQFLINFINLSLQEDQNNNCVDFIKFSGENSTDSNLPEPVWVNSNNANYTGRSWIVVRTEA